VQREREKDIWGDMQRAPREDAEKAGTLETRQKKKQKNKKQSKKASHSSDIYQTTSFVQ
jgi:hypothetical protein